MVIEIVSAFAGEDVVDAGIENVAGWPIDRCDQFRYRCYGIAGCYCC